MNLLGIPIKHELAIYINEQGQVRALLPKLETQQEVMTVCQALINQAAQLAQMYGIKLQIQERKE